MKVFISHSSKDKWAARRISEDLNNLGAATFLDEKDIETGHSIDDSIKKHLKECQDFLILISPASLKSEWVLIELGAAMVLEKKIVPILFYVGANEIPQAINLRLSRDINSIQLYYDEVKGNLGGKVEVQKPIQQKVQQYFNIGDRVKVVGQRPSDIMREDFLLDWEQEMDIFLGITSEIIEVNPQGVTESYILKNDPIKFLFAREWLIKI